MVTTNQRSVLVAWTNESHRSLCRPQGHTSTSGLHVACGPIRGRGYPTLANGGCSTNHCTAEFTQWTERLWGGDQMHEWNKTINKNAKPKSKYPKFSFKKNLKIFSPNQPSHQPTPAPKPMFYYIKLIYYENTECMALENWYNTLYLCLKCNDQHQK